MLSMFARLDEHELREFARPKLKMSEPINADHKPLMMHADFDIGCLLAIYRSSLSGGVSPAISSLACQAVAATKAGHFLRLVRHCYLLRSR
jgi:hypothetical protein